ncbi:WG repeat-containing protein [Flavobacterium sp. NKUCC04_CG]|uniref:WG repeat-containing protein n=1 Tax=Flavobacterium sp. NKUCC04_CG TaxID=2842121 RepID=UPI001C5B9DC3|nr:WG repeat-containing protein [Flavobacterium sp. NKUCC04_CG]MBW3517904.1 WG repeat-containing protein [Flavobacterium sp. NKUCC04_CG]
MRMAFLLIYLFIVATSFSQNLKATLVFERLDQNNERKQGLIDSVGNIILPAEYGSIKVTNDGKYIVASKQKGYRSDSYKGFVTDRIFPDYKYGVLDKNLKTVLPFIYDHIDTYKKPYYYVSHEEKGVAVFNKKFKEIFPFKYEIVQCITEPYKGFFYITKDGFTGVVKKNGRQIIEEKPLWIEPISKKLFAVKVKGKNHESYAAAPYYLMDKDLNKVGDFSFNFFRFLTPKVILFSSGTRKLGLMGTEGTILLPAEYDQIFYDERSKVYIVKTAKFGMLNENLNIILPTEYDEIKPSKDNKLFLIGKDKKYGFVNARGKMVIDIKYEAADVFSEGLAPVLKDGKWGFINEKDEVMIPFQFVGKMKSFENGYATFYQDKVSTNQKTPLINSKSVFINKKGRMIGKLQEGDIRYFLKDKAIRYNRYGQKPFEHLIDLKTGEIIFDLKPL